MDILSLRQPLLSPVFHENANVKPFDITGRPMAGWVMVIEARWKGTTGLTKWIGTGKQFALSLPEKKIKVKAKNKDVEGV